MEGKPSEEKVRGLREIAGNVKNRARTALLDEGLEKVFFEAVDRALARLEGQGTNNEVMLKVGKANFLIAEAVVDLADTASDRQQVEQLRRKLSPVFPHVPGGFWDKCVRNLKGQKG